MAKNIQVNLTFNADTKAAKANMRELQQQLNSLANIGFNAKGFNIMANDINAASQSALKLKSILENTTNVNTGKLNFTKFNQQLKSSGMTLQSLGRQLGQLGPQGVQAFSNLATSIRQAETPLIQLKGKMGQLMTTFSNTIRWSISSSIIQGVTSAFTSTIDYAKELNESLTNIRIVTGKTMQDMSKFAQEANKAAKMLSSSTTEYTNASLIYFQQGLNDKAVKERTETTIKLANVLGESAETVSDWMTAIWNNFDNGSASLEHYADVLAKLGAATASSADEIAGGLEKFAAIADTVGLSYEYAASALATITAETRQSEDVVGTALKTIFARIENLKLGEALDDGTNLGQYSEALYKIGVNIKDSNGNLREMDGILNDIGARWQTLAKDEQVALAQSVAGIRQYNQFIALMDNWDVMENNVAMAKAANNELTKQHKIYEQGINGALKRNKAELEQIKNTFLDEDDLLPLLNASEGLLDLIGKLSEAFGGLPGILALVASIGLKVWGPSVANGFRSAALAVQGLFQGLTGVAQAEQQAASVEAASISKRLVALSNQDVQGEVRFEVLEKIEGIQSTMLENEKLLTSEMRTQLKVMLQLLDAKGKSAEQTGEEIDNLNQQADLQDKELKGDPLRQGYIDEARKYGMLQGEGVALGRTDKGKKSPKEFISEGDKYIEKLRNENLSSTEIEKAWGKTNVAAQDLQNFEENENKGVLRNELVQKQMDGSITPEETEQLQHLDNESKRLVDALNDAQKEFEETISSTKVFSQALEELQKNLNVDLQEEADNQSKQFTQSHEDIMRGKSKNLTEQQVDDFYTTLPQELRDDPKVENAKNNLKANIGQGNVDAVKKYKKELMGLTKVDETRTKIQTEANSKIEASNKLLEDGFKISEETAIKTGELNDKKSEANKIEEESYKLLNQKPKNDFFTSFTNGMQQAASAAAGFTMITSGIEQLNEAMKNGEADFNTWISSFSSILFGATMLLPVIKNLWTGIRFLTTVQKENNLVGMKSILVDTAKIIVKKKGTQAQKDEVAAMKWANAEKAKENAKDIFGIVTDIAKQAAKGPIGWATAAVSAALVAALIGISIAVNGANKGNTKEKEKQAEEAQEYADQTSEAYNRVRESYENLKSSLEDYISASNAIDKLKEGTLEWRQAIVEANQQIMELLNSYPELASYVDNINGRLVISEEGMNKALMAKNNEMIAAANINNRAQVASQRANFELTQAKAINGGVLDSYTSEDVWKDVGLGVATALGSVIAMAITGGAAIPAIVAGVSTALTASAGSGAFAKEKETREATENAISTLSDLYLENPEVLKSSDDMVQALEKVGVDISNIDDTLKENFEEVKKLVTTNAQLVEQEKLLNQQAATNLFMNSSQAQNTKHFGDRVTELAGEEYERQKNKIIEEFNQKGSEINVLNGSTISLSGLELVDEWARIYGYSEAKPLQFTTKDRGIEYENSENGAKSFITFEGIKEEIAEYRLSTEEGQAEFVAAINEMTSITAGLSGMWNYGSETKNTTANAIGSFLSEGKINSINKDQAEELKKQFSEGEKFDYKDFITDEELNNFGYVGKDAGKKFVEEFKAALETYDVNEYYRAQQERIDSVIQAGSASLDISENALSAYAQYLSETNEGLKDNGVGAAQLAVQHYKMAKGLSSLNKVFQENVKVLAQGESAGLQYYEALGKVQTQLEDTFGIKVSHDLVESQLGNIQKAAEGDVEALKELREELTKDYILNLTINEISKQALLQEIQELVDEASSNSGVSVDLLLDNQQAISGLNEALVTGQATIQEIESLFNNANLSMPEYHSVKKPNVSTSTSTTKITKGPQAGTEYKTETTNTTYTEIPYFGDTPPKFDSAGNTLSYGGGLHKNTKGLTVSSSGNTNSDQLALGYDDVSASEAADRKKDAEDELDPLHEETKRVESATKAYERLGDAKDKAYGKNKLALMSQEIKALDKVIARNKELLKAQKDEAVKYRGALQKGFGAKFDKEGNISNYEELQQSELNRLNSVLTNPSSSKEAQEAAQERYDQFKEWASNYENMVQDIQDTEETITEQEYEKLNKKLEKTSYAIEYKLELSENARDNIQHQIDRLNDKPFEIAAKIKLYEDQTDTYLQDSKNYKKGIKNILKDSGATDKQIKAFMSGDASAVEGLTFTEDQLQQLKEYGAGLQETENNLRETHQNIHEDLMANFEAWNEKFDIQINKMEHYDSVVSSIKNIADLTGTNKGDAAKAIRQTQAQIANDQVASQKNILDANQKALSEARKKWDDAKARGDKEAAEKWREQVIAYEQQVFDSEEAVYEALQNAIQRHQELFKESVLEDLENLQKAINNGLTIAQVEERYSKESEKDERYLNEYEKTYELNKISRQIQKDIDATDNLAAQQALNKLLAKANEYREDNVQLSADEIQMLQKEYEIEKARIAMEEAQNAKSQVKLQRNASGGYSYVYTADQDKVSEATQNYEDSIKAYYDFTQELADKHSKAMIDAQKAFVDEINAIDLSVFNTTEKWQAEVNRITEYYTGKMQYHSSQMDIMFTQNDILMQGHVGEHVRQVGEMTTAEAGWVSNLGDTILGVTTGQSGSAMDYFNQFKNQLGYCGKDGEEGSGILNDIATNFGTMTDNINGALQSVYGPGFTLEQFGSKAKEILVGSDGKGGISAQSSQAAGKVKTLTDNMIKEFPKATDAVDNWEKKYTPKIKNAKSASDKLNGVIEDLIATKFTTFNSRVKTAASTIESNFGKNSSAYKAVKSLLSKLNDLNDIKVNPVINDKDNNITTGKVTLEKVASTNKDWIKANGQWYYVNGKADDYKDKVGQEISISGLEGGYTLTPRKNELKTLNDDYIVKLKDKFYIKGDYQEVEEGYYVANESSGYDKLSDAIKNMSESDLKRLGKFAIPNKITDTYGKGTTPGDATWSFDGDNEKDYKIIATNGEYVKVQQVSKDGMPLGGNNQFRPRNQTEAWFDIDDLFKQGNFKFDTGGYTGSWGPEGRWAMLHQKEIVLNAKDTENFLHAIEIVRQLASQIDLQASAMANGVWLNQLQSFNLNGNQTTLDQNVTIHAEFPNVTQHSEIEQAFENLINKASQFANRK